MNGGVPLVMTGAAIVFISIGFATGYDAGKEKAFDTLCASKCYPHLCVARRDLVCFCEDRRESLAK